MEQRSQKKGSIVDLRVLKALELAKDLLKAKSTINILEVGCNSGTFLTSLKHALVNEGYSNRFSLQGIDIDKAAIQSSTDSQINLHHSSAEEFLKVTKVKYDLIFTL